MTRNTSIQTYREIEANHLLSRMRFKVYQILFENGPMTAGELYQLAKSSYGNKGLRDNYQKRLPELRRLGVVREVGEARCKATGRNVIVWDVTNELPIKLDKQETKTQKITRLEKLIAELKLENSMLKNLLGGKSTILFTEGVKAAKQLKLFK